MAAPLRFRRSRHVVCHWIGKSVILTNYAAGTRALGPACLCTILSMCEDSCTLDAVAAALAPVPPQTVAGLVAKLERSRMLYRSDRKEPAAERAMAQLAPWNPAAGFFHTVTKDVLFSDRREFDRAFRAKTREKPPPPSVKRYRGNSIVLSTPPRDGQFADVLLARRTWRRFARQPLPLDELSLLLDLTAGIQHWMISATGDRSPLKTSPSGGARHPIDVYVAARRVDGLPRGLYHYAADRHRLDRIRGGLRGREVVDYLPQQDWYADAAVLLLFVASFDRTLYRYPYARAYRSTLIEAGHLCQTFCLTATWRGLAPFCTMALADTAIERDLGLDGIRESVLYAAGVGLRDGDVPTAPRDVAPLRIEPNRPLARRRASRRGSSS